VSTAPGAVFYEMTLAGHLGDHWCDRLSGLALIRNDDGTTTLTGPVADQAHLHGILAGLRDIGVALLSLSSRPERPAHAARALDRPLHTQRLTLRAATAEDADPTWAFRRLESVNEWLAGCPESVEGYRELFSDPTRLSSTVVVQLGHDPDGPVVGDLMLRRQDAWAQSEMTDAARGVQAEVGWVLDPTRTGRGYATEAVRELLRHGFEDLGVRRVTANCFLANDASWRLMERVGMRRELHTVRESLHRSGRWLDVVGYAVLADEWTPA
jgi:RimJ/RimL family protein N-acetyltransferase